MMRWVSLLLGAVMFVMAGCGGSTGGAGGGETKNLKFEVVEQGDYSGIGEQKAVLITTQADWEKFWVDHDQSEPKAELPAIDFSKESVLAVFMGMKGSGGYAVEVQNVKLSGNTLTVDVKTTEPEGMAITVMTQPFQLVKIEKPAGNVTVQVNW